MNRVLVIAATGIIGSHVVFHSIRISPLQCARYSGTRPLDQFRAHFGIRQIAQKNTMVDRKINR
jgi:hypothetical protein